MTGYGTTSVTEGTNLQLCILYVTTEEESRVSAALLTDDYHVLTCKEKTIINTIYIYSYYTETITVLFIISLKAIVSVIIIIRSTTGASGRAV
jgi:hypothetical protein